jgi:hypothetical protein
MVESGEPIDQGLRLAAKDVNRARVRRMCAEYGLLCELIAPIERTLWRLLQRKERLADELANEGVKPFCEPQRSAHRPQEGGPNSRP